MTAAETDAVLVITADYAVHAARAAFCARIKVAFAAAEADAASDAADYAAWDAAYAAACPVEGDEAHNHEVKCAAENADLAAAAAKPAAYKAAFDAVYAAAYAAAVLAIRPASVPACEPPPPVVDAVWTNPPSYATPPAAADTGSK